MASKCFSQSGLTFLFLLQAVIVVHSSGGNLMRAINLLLSDGGEVVLTGPNSSSDDESNTTTSNQQCHHHHCVQSHGNHCRQAELPQLYIRPKNLMTEPDDPSPLHTRSDSQNLPDTWEPACNQVRRYVMMDRAVNQDGQVVRLYQPPESSVVQFIYNVTCVNSGQSCSVVKDRYESKCETYWEYVLARVAAPHTSHGYIEDYISVAVSCNCVVKERSYGEPLYQIVDSS